ncbi:MAG TPA: DUF4846 domain-containing protein [Mobilitalea sp.]|nr:DUF4846 domain-containing protein [Mobilitalea sp.]
MAKKNIYSKISYVALSKYCILVFLVVFALYGCSPKKAAPNIENPSPTDSPYESSDIPSNQKDPDMNSAGEQQEPDPSVDVGNIISAPTFTYINPEGSTLEDRVNPPNSFSRIPSSPEELTGFIRSLHLKDDGSSVLKYDGNPIYNQENHIAVFDLDLGDRDLQQCADSVMRVFAEYYWSLGEYDKIAFHLTNGFLMEYTKWRDGNRIKVEGNDVSWTNTASFDDSYKAFRKYLDMVYAYAGTLSLSQECEDITLEELLPGDLLLQGGSPGHCILVVDIAENEAGKRCFLLAQGYMPAQDFHIIKNFLHEEDPWYYEDEFSFPLDTPSWTFKEGSLVRWSQFPLISDESVSAISDAANVDSENALSQVKLLAVGDNLIHIEVVNSGKQSDGSYNFDHLYSNLAKEISEADIAVVNQETILGGEDFSYSGYPSFNSPIEIGEALANVGFDVVLHATNHTMDMGLKAVQNTFSFWSDYPEITILGINQTEEDRDTIPIVTKNGIKLALLNYTYGLNGYKLPKGMPYLVNLLDKKQMTEDITKAKELADFIIVFPHWGSEYVYEATSMQKDLTALYYELGVDLVIGAHPHVLEPVEWIETEPGHRMLVYYSLGNFMSYQKEAPRMLGGLANITIFKDAEGTYISEAGITPIVTHYEHGPADYRYGLYKLTDYSPEQAKLHGVSDIAQRGAFTYDETYGLAKQVLGTWFTE